MKTRIQSEEIQKYILQSVGKFEGDLSAATAQRFEISRQAVNGHIRKLIADGKLTQAGRTKGATYSIVRQKSIRLKLPVSQINDEHRIWEDLMKPRLKDLGEGSMDIWAYVFTEMLNNVISHSEGQKVRIMVSQSAVDTRMLIQDDGVGIFGKVQRGLGLPQKRDAVVELMKGGITTDKENHTGLGIFYSSRLMDIFVIRSEQLTFGIKLGPEEESLLLDDPTPREKGKPGTSVSMYLSNTKPANFLKDFFNKVAPDVESPQPTIGSLMLHLVEEKGSPLVSRSQAKMLMARMNVYKTIVLDFEGIDFIGQGFADQIFRIFAREHPAIKLVPKNENKDVRKMIRMAQNALEREHSKSPQS